MADKIRIEALENGPFKISNAKNIAFAGDVSELDGDCFLCRCGKSGNAPYCDGTHAVVGFKGAADENAKKDIRVWEGKRIKTFFNPNVCMHVFYCKPLKELRAKEGDDATTESAKEIAQACRSCPSGALTYEFNEAINIETQVPSADLEIVEGAEIRVTRNFENANFELGERQTAEKATLCRCGLSTNKPFCDGSHRKAEDFK